MDMDAMEQQSYNCTYCKVPCSSFLDRLHHQHKCQQLIDISKRLDEDRKHILDTQSSFTQLSIEDFSNFENVVERILILGRWHQDNAHLLE
jgi:thiamine kinase-like enzyme